MHDELNLWMATEIRWKRKEVSRGSPDLTERRRPISSRKLEPSTQMGPNVSMAKGTNK